MQSKKPAAASKPKFLVVRVRFTPEELQTIKAAAANRGLGFNLFLRLVSAGTAERVLKESPKEELVGRFLDASLVLQPGRQPSESALE